MDWNLTTYLTLQLYKIHFSIYFRYSLLVVKVNLITISNYNSPIDRFELSKLGRIFLPSVHFANCFSKVSAIRLVHDRSPILARLFSARQFYHDRDLFFAPVGRIINRRFHPPFAGAARARSRCPNLTSIVTLELAAAARAARKLVFFDKDRSDAFKGLFHPGEKNLSNGRRW